MPLSNPFTRVPGKFRPLAYIAAAVSLLALVWILSLALRPEFPPLPDFAAIEDVGEMKRAFYGYMTPIVQHQNSEIRTQRARLLELDRAYRDEATLSRRDRRWLNDLALEYEIDAPGEVEAETLLNTLKLRVDIIPLELALTQAAKESGWGRSRFAVEANNLFGQWCYDPGCGIVPANRAAGASHEVREFRSVSEAVRRYMNNLNSHERYLEFRLLRQKLRREDAPVTGLALADGLLYYSQRREVYVQRLKSMIRQYRELEPELNQENA